MIYDDDHWKILLQTIIDRVGMEHFIVLIGQVVEADIQKIIDARMLETLREAQGEKP